MARCPSANSGRGAERLAVEVEVARRALLEPEPVVIRRVLEELGRLLQHVLVDWCRLVVLVGRRRLDVELRGRIGLLVRRLVGRAFTVLGR